MIKERLKSLIEQSIDKAIREGKMGTMTENSVPVIIEKPRFAEHGDLACGVALKLASAVKSSPIKIAETIAENIEAPPDAVSRFSVAPPGFINFQLGTGWLEETISDIIKQESKYGVTDLGKGHRVLVEYVSANPTGDLHIGHGRGAVYGSCLSKLLSFAGFKVEQEFYVNDTGEQIAQLGRSGWAGYQRKLGRDVPYPEEGYPEDSLALYIDQLVSKHGDQYLQLEDGDGQRKLGDLLKQIIMDAQKELLGKLGIVFDRWYSELTLHASGKVPRVLQKFEELGTSYQADGALWLKSKEFGDERDRVLKKSTGAITYLAADAAYHLDKYERGYDHLITIWGADHHGQVPGLKAAVQALGQDPSKLEIILTQIVNLQREGQIVRMSKRMGTVVTLEEVMDEVGVDATRYYLAESNPQNPINFDLELAKQTSKENPAFYIQYAHARCCAILRKALEPSINTETGTEEPPPVSTEQWAEWLKSYSESPQGFKAIFETDPQIFLHQKALIARLESFPEEVEEAATLRIPGKLARYAYDVANDLQKFYEVCRVITPDPEITRARLGLIVATRQVLANALGIIGVTAPERM
jgi:arginyl-tRNA synthetase